MGMMVDDLLELAVQIVRVVNDSFPGWVECEFFDADGHRHHLIDKWPIFTTEVLDADSKYPRPGTARCKLLRRWRDPQGRDVVTITTALPFSIESVDGQTEFSVLRSQVMAVSDVRP
jgi:hypothetical protein